MFLLKIIYLIFACRMQSISCSLHNVNFVLIPSTLLYTRQTTKYCWRIFYETIRCWNQMFSFQWTLVWILLKITNINNYDMYTRRENLKCIIRLHNNTSKITKRLQYIPVRWIFIERNENCCRVKNRGK